MTESNFNLHPKEGYGVFKFGTSIAENRKYSSIYGEMRECSLYPDESIWQSMLDSEQSEEFKKIILEAREDSLSNKELQQMNFGKYVTLLFKRDKLIEISIDRGGISVFLHGRDLFSMDGKDMTHYAARILNENPYIDEDDIYFRSHYMMIFGYTDGVENGNVNWRPYTPKNPHEMRSIVIYDGPRRESEDFTNRFIYKVI
jgi:hypothetical protein